MTHKPVVAGGILLALQIFAQTSVAPSQAARLAANQVRGPLVLQRYTCQAQGAGWDCLGVTWVEVRLTDGSTVKLVGTDGASVVLDGKWVKLN
jgi:hypothetical protein